MYVYPYSRTSLIRTSVNRTRRLTERATRPHPLINKRTYARVSKKLCVGQLSAFIQAHTNHMASPATAGSSRKRKRVVLSIEDKLKMCDLAESGRCWSKITHINEHYCSFLSQSAIKRLSRLRLVINLYPKCVNVH